MQRIGPALVLSVLLHVGLFLLLFLSWKAAPKPLPVSSVPAELVSSVPMHQQAEAPVDKLAVKTPVPEPAPEEPVKPEPKPEPAPKLPVPTPQKEIAKPEPKPAPAVPDKNGLKKPAADKNAKTPPAKPSLDLNALSQLGAAPSKSKSRQQAQANTHKTQGMSNFGSAPADAGTNTALKALTDRLIQLWSPNCDVPGGNLVQPDIKFTISPNGRVTTGPEWSNPRNDPVWEAGAARAQQAVKRGELYTDLPDGLYNRPLIITFDAKTACGR
jgi:outer membrane biosynthesis protein TonB